MNAYHAVQSPATYTCDINKVWVKSPKFEQARHERNKRKGQGGDKQIGFVTREYRYQELAFQIGLFTL